MTIFLIPLLFLTNGAHSGEKIPIEALVRQINRAVVQIPKGLNSVLSCDFKAKPFHSDVAPECESFMDSKGNYGIYGYTVASQILNHTLSSNENEFLKTNFPGMMDDPYICPNWAKMSHPDRLNFWVWTFGAIAHVESSCDAKAINPNGTDGRAIGLFQLNEEQSTRNFKGGIRFGLTDEQADKLGLEGTSRYRLGCNYRDSMAIDGQAGKIGLYEKSIVNTLCAVDMMHEFIRRKKADEYYENETPVPGKKIIYGNGKIYGSGSYTYWQELRNYNDGGKIGALIRAFPKCQTR